MNPIWSLIALAVGAFGIGTTEFAPMGLLPVIADGVKVSIPTAGLLISAYALGVMLAAPVMTLALSRLRARQALMLLMSIFVVGNLLSAAAPNYWMLLAARVVTSLNHGAFFGIGSVLAASLVAPDKRASAVATMFMGLTIANIGGVPAATWVGQHIGWRMAFAGTAGLGLLAIAALAWTLPRGGQSGAAAQPAAAVSAGSAQLFVQLGDVGHHACVLCHLQRAVVGYGLAHAGAGFAQRLAGRGQAQYHVALVARIAATADVALRFQPLDQRGDGTGILLQPGGDILHAQALALP
jgi:predicted MFS family arabinose efflux permease